MGFRGWLYFFFIVKSTSLHDTLDSHNQAAILEIDVCVCVCVCVGGVGHVRSAMRGCAYKPGAVQDFGNY